MQRVAIEQNLPTWEDKDNQPSRFAQAGDTWTQELQFWNVGNPGQMEWEDTCPCQWMGKHTAQHLAHSKCSQIPRRTGTSSSLQIACSASLTGQFLGAYDDPSRSTMIQRKGPPWPLEPDCTHLHNNKPSHLPAWLLPPTAFPLTWWGLWAYTWTQPSVEWSPGPLCVIFTFFFFFCRGYIY